MNPKSGKACKIVPPADPVEVFDADNANPGKVSEAKAEQVQQEKGKYGQTLVKPHKPDPEKTSWIEIELVDEADLPVPGMPYRITLSDGKTVAEGTLDEKGFARVDGIDPGSCKVTFPKQDKSTWHAQ